MNMVNVKLSVVFIFLCVNVITSDTVCNTSKLNTCSFIIDDNSVNNLKSQFKETESLSAKIRLKFASPFKSTNGTILPTDWIMTTRGKYGGDFFTAWPVDYSLYSFGFLNSRMLSDIPLNITVNPPGCDVLIGNINTDCGITHALSAQINIQIKESHHNHSLKWCYIKEYKEARDTIWYTMMVYFGLPYAMFGFHCCQEDERVLSCEDEYNMQWNGYQVLPYYVGIVFFCFFPIFLMKFSARAMDSGNKFKDKSNLYEDLDSDKDEWVYLQTRSPVTFSKLILGMFGLGIKHPVTASRIRRVIFVFIAPIAIYVEILMYHLGWPELVPALVKAKIPFGFASIAGGIVDCHPLFLPMIGGPFVALLTYLMIGIIVLALPRDLGKAVEKGISSDGNEIEKDYFELLHQTIKAVKHMKGEKSKREEIQSTDVSESTVVIKQEMVVIGEHNSNEQEQLREKNKLPGIQRDLYEYVVRKHRPLHIAIFMTVIQICIMTFLVFASIIYVSRFVDVQETDEKHEIFHVISILLITILPNLVHRVFTPIVNNKVRKHKIRQTVDNFYHMRI
ncbi:unnamed protein product [Mytilus edulis]|uniref:Uncharacterized protein n=1 Tax=Mytilus edulis TaxID=6550 RepID=A0A8S3RQA7_MYTED|nr:unnamed protein product [Mytilus edulis]